MSIVVPLDQLSAAVNEFGPVAYLLSSGGDGRPRAVSVAVTTVDGRLQASIGGRTAANIDTQSLISLLWPRVGDGPFSLIVDGEAELLASPAANPGGAIVSIRPTSAVRHRTAIAT